MAVCVLLASLVPCAQAKRTLAQKKLAAQAQFETAEKMREALNGRPQSERTRRDYNRVSEAFRKVYVICANFRKADESIVDTAELLAETGRAFHDPDASREAIAQYQFLMREYPGSVHNTAAMFTIAKIYQEDLHENDKAKAAFEDFLRRHPQHRLSDDARQALEDIAHPQSAKTKEKKKSHEPANDRGASPDAAHTQREGSSAVSANPKPGGLTTTDDAAVDQTADLRNPVIDGESHPDEGTRKGSLPLVTGIRHWSTPDYTRVAIDLEDEVKYEAGRIPSPDRVFFDLQSTKLAPELIGKSFEVGDGFLRKIRVAQYQRGVTRVVLEVDPVSEYSAFLLPNPYRLIIDIHGKPQAPVMAVSPVGKTSTGDKGAQAEKTAAAAKPPASTPPAVTTARNPSNATPNGSQPQATASGQSAVVSAVLPSSAVWTPAGKSTQDVHKPSEDNRGGANRSLTSETKSGAEKSNTKAPLTEAARNDPATSLAVGKSNEPELKATNKPTTAPTFEQVTPRVEHGTSADTRAADSSSERSATLEASRSHTSAPSDASPSSADVESSHSSQSKPDHEIISDMKETRPRRSKDKDRDTEVVSHEAQPTADGQRSLIRALGLKIGRIVVDAGHGGHDTGTVGPHGLEEKDLVLDVALRLGKLLQKKMGAEVVYTRNDDTFIPLETRTAIANQNQADLFISVHANSSPDPSARGVETYYLNFTSSTEALEVAARENAVSEKSIHELQDLVKKIALKEKIEESREFATDVQGALSSGLSTRSSKMRSRGVKKAPFIVLIGANMPSILAEISFVSNPGDERKLQTSDYRQKIAESLYRGIAKYVAGLSGMKMALNRNGD